MQIAEIDTCLNRLLAYTVMKRQGQFLLYPDTTHMYNHIISCTGTHYHEETVQPSRNRHHTVVCTHSHDTKLAVSYLPEQTSQATRAVGHLLGTAVAHAVD